MLANVLLLARRELIGVEAIIADGDQTLRVLRGERPARSPPPRAACLSLVGAPGDLLTLLPLAGDVEGVSTAGLLYPLADETLVFRAGAAGQQRVRGRGRTHLAAAWPAARDSYPNPGGLR